MAIVDMTNVNARDPKVRLIIAASTPADFHASTASWRLIRESI
jgi:hypothetical protein